MFNYEKAFSRNIGWVTKDEQLILKGKRIGIIGSGGVGGEHLVTLTRLGIGKFNTSDFDEFEVHNFNRQAGAFLSTVGQPKSEVMERIARDINPELQINDFPRGIDESNVDEFLEDIDVYVDALDFFALKARKLVFNKCLKKNIPVITAAPLGMGTALLCFMPGKMSYEEYFRFDDKKEEDEQLIQFLIGLSPSMMQRHYMVDQSTVNFDQKKGPSTPMAVKQCAGVAGTYVLKILLGRGKVLTAPWGMHIDPYLNKSKKTYLLFGNRGPIQRIKFNKAKNIVL